MNPLSKMKIKSIGFDDDIEFKNLDITQLVKNYMIKEAFSIFDEDGSGDIDKSEFRKLVQTLGWGIPDSKISELMKEVDKDGSGTVDFEEFSKMMNNYQFTKDSPISQHLENAFNLYDKDGDGYINSEDFKNVGEEIDGVFNDKDADLFINMSKYFSKINNIKQKDDTKICKEEFTNFLYSINFLEESKNEKLRSVNTENTVKSSTSFNVSRSNSRMPSNKSSYKI